MIWCNTKKLKFKDVKKMPPDKKILVNTVKLENIEITLLQIYNYKKWTYLDLIRCKAVGKLIKNEELIRNLYFIELPVCVALFLFRNFRVKFLENTFYEIINYDYE